ncbi:hypothetical protein TNCV_2064141 [Trichonephila clavipes]|nr:hypothetical protein TNCV_2064141 [Trichonephila clavipes]
MKFIPFDEIRVKSPYAFAMDFCALGLLKGALGKKHPRTLTDFEKRFKRNGVQFADSTEKNFAFVKNSS